MDDLIINGQVQTDPWRLFQHQENNLPPDQAHWLIPLSLWQAHSITTWQQRRYPVALLLEPDTDLNTVFTADYINVLPRALALIAIHFPVYTDGRGYSLAQLLRQKYNWTGELRAVGDVMIDTMHYLARCGFTSFKIKPGHDPHQALAALTAFTKSYQKSYLRP